MDKLKQHQTADALAVVIIFISVLSRSKILAGVGLFFLVGNVLDWKINGWIVKIWNKFSHFMGGIVTKVLLFLMFYLFFTPLAWLFRIFNKQSLAEFFNKKKDSYYKHSSGDIKPELFERMW